MRTPENQSRLLAVLLMAVSANAAAFKIDTPINDFDVRWDNTLRYTLAWRLAHQDPALLANFGIDDGDRNFNRGLVSNRLDLLSEFDAVYKNNFGFRVSGAGWYDNAYAHAFDNTSVATSNHLENGQPAIGISRYADRLYRGPSGELLDAFAIAKFDLGDVPLSFKAGRHAILWGESLLLGGAAHGVSYAQVPLDLAKGFAVPGSEIKELFRPLNNISMQTQPFESLSVAAQYFLAWEPYRVPEAGTFLGFNDALLAGGESVILRNGVRVVRAADLTSGQRGNYGLAARWNPEFLDGTLGFYHRRFTDMVPQVAVVPDVAKIAANNCGTGASQTGACSIVGEYRFNYPGDIKLYGLSFSKNVAGISIGTEFNYRENMPLFSEPAVVVPQEVPAALQPQLESLLHGLHQASLPPGAPAIPPVVVRPLPGEGGAVGARGNTMHGVINGLGLLQKTELLGFTLFDTGSWIVELTWSHWNRVSEHEELFKGRADYTALDRVTRNNYSAAIAFAPTWFQVFPAVDLSMPLSYSRGLVGNSTVQLGGNKGAGTYGVGLSADIFARYRVDLKYANFFGEYTTDANGAAAVLNGTTAALSDRGFVSLTLKTTF